ncbi:MAG: hypothetical protein M3Q56_12965 [Bacteroidota bacterium]|nr:hypothetical protein [Bacteroidota bacterium]
MKSVYSFFVIAIFFNYCPLAECGSYNTTLFNSEIHIIPEKPSFRIGDTLWLASKILCHLKNSNGMQEVNTCFSRKNLETIIYILQIDTTQTTSLISAPDKFDYVNKTGSSRVDASVNWHQWIVSYQRNTLDWTIETALICKQVGIYALKLGSIVLSRDTQECDEEIIELNISNLEHHFSLYHGRVNIDSSEIDSWYFFEVL